MLTGTTALRFTATGEPLAARRIRILPTNQHARWPNDPYEVVTIQRSQELFKLLSLIIVQSGHESSMYLAETDQEEDK